MSGNKMISNVSKLVHDKVTLNDGFRPLRYNCEQPLNALAVNKDFTQVVVAGRQVFKILAIKEDCFVETTNLRVGKHSKRVNLDYSAADVAWHPSDENILASAATNGSVVVWNLSKSAKSKQATIFTEHKRSVNRVMFHGAEHNLLLSASQDGVVMLHDLRTAKVANKFGVSGTDSVRDAQFCPTNVNYFTFAAAYDNGNVQTWDLRVPGRFERQFMAHSGPVFSLDWHNSEKDKSWWLATAGRDKFIKVWEMQRDGERSGMPACLYSITNILPVAKVRWRMKRKSYLSSCSLHIDCCVNVWDVNRPYIPFATFDGHTDAASCIVWRDDHTFLTCGRDGYIIQHVFRDAKRPADHVNLSGVDFSINGDIGHAYSDKREQTSGSLPRSKRVTRSQQFKFASSALFVFRKEFSNVEEEELMMTKLPEVALNYKLEGQSISELCLHNSDVAKYYKKPQVCQSWRMLSVIYSTCLASQVFTNHPSRASSTLKLNPTPQKEADKAIKPALKRSREKEKKKNSQMAALSEPSGSSDESSEVEGEISEVDKSAADLNVGSNFMFSDGELPDNLEMAGAINRDSAQDWKLQMLPYEGFQTRHDFKADAMMMTSHPLMDEDLSQLALGSTADPLSMAGPDSVELTEPVLTVRTPHEVQGLDFSDTTADVIKHFAEQGDVQTAVSMLIVLGDHLKHHIDEAFQESWFFAYIDLLGRYELWTTVNTVIKHSKLLGVCTLNQKSTVIHTRCAKCNSSCERAAWLCDKCKRNTGLCSVCHLPVKGLMVWCQGCCHGGHLEHMREWMAVNVSCPAGCGHHCEYV